MLFDDENKYIHATSYSILQMVLAVFRGMARSLSQVGWAPFCLFALKTKKYPADGLC